MLALAVGGKSVVCEAAIVAVIMLDGHTMMQGKLFECLFRSNGFVGREVAHEVDVPKGREVVNKDGGGGEALLGEFSF